MSANIQLKIEKLSQFAKEEPDSRRLNDAVYLHGLPWKILAIPRETGRRLHQQKCLGYFLQCNADNADPAWSCNASATLKILAQKKYKKDHVRQITHVFNAKENDWGYAQFMSFEELMNPVRGWYDKETDSIILSVDFTAYEPQGIKLPDLPNIQSIQQRVDESAKGLTTKNAEYQKRKQELEIEKKLTLQAVEEIYLKEIGQLEAENLETNADFAQEMNSLKDELKEKINWDQVDYVMGKKLVVNPMELNWWNLATIKNSRIFLSCDGLKATNNGNATANVYHNYNSVTAEKGFHISADFAGPVLYYFEVIILSKQYKGEILVGLSSGNIPDGTFVGELPNSYAIEDGGDYCWISEKTHQFEWPYRAIKPVVIGCGLVLNPAKELSLFFTANGILLGNQIPIKSTVNTLYPTVSMYGFGYGSVEANFGDNPAKQFSYDIKKCPGLVFE